VQENRKNTYERVSRTNKRTNGLKGGKRKPPERRTRERGKGKTIKKNLPDGRVTKQGICTLKGSGKDPLSMGKGNKQ